jgi:hypothetical protein
MLLHIFNFLSIFSYAKTASVARVSCRITLYSAIALQISSVYQHCPKRFFVMGNKGGFGIENDYSVDITRKLSLAETQRRGVAVRNRIVDNILYNNSAPKYIPKFFAALRRQNG